MNGAVRKSYNKLEPDSSKVKNNSPQFNVSLHVRFIHVFIFMPLLRPSSPTHNLLCYAYAPLLRTMLCLCLHRDNCTCMSISVHVFLESNVHVPYVYHMNLHSFHLLCVVL